MSLKHYFHLLKHIPLFGAQISCLKLITKKPQYLYSILVAVLSNAIVIFLKLKDC